MEIVILVSVLCTLGVVGIVTAILVAFNKLNKKVDDNNNYTNRDINGVFPLAWIVIADRAARLHRIGIYPIYDKALTHDMGL